MRTILFYLLCFVVCFLLTWGTIVLVDRTVQIDGNWAMLSLLLSIENIALFFVFRKIIKK